jgi:hypothetical protein
MTYDHWKTTEPDDGAERPDGGEDEREKLCAELDTCINNTKRLRASHDALLEAAKTLIQRLPVPLSAARPEFTALAAAIAKAEELAP